MAEEPDTLTTSPGQASTAPSGLLDFLKRPPLYLIAQAYRDTAFDADELQAINVHIESWRDLLARHGVLYEGIVLDGKDPQYPDLIYHLSTAVDPKRYPASLPLVLDALYELSQDIAEAEWEVYGLEQLVTRYEKDADNKCLRGGQRIFAQQIKGRPAPDEREEITQPEVPHPNIPGIPGLI